MGKIKSLEPRKRGNGRAVIDPKSKFFHPKSIKMWSLFGTLIIGGGLSKLMSLDKWVLDIIDAPAKVSYLHDAHISDSTRLNADSTSIFWLRWRINKDDSLKWKHKK